MTAKSYYAGTTTPTSVNPQRRFISVLVVMPHVSKYGQKKVMTLTYGCTFEVKVGDPVWCPPTRLNGKWIKGSVKSLDPTGYAGPVKYVGQFNRPATTAQSNQQPVHAAVQHATERA